MDSNERERRLSQALQDLRRRTGMLHSLLRVTRVESTKQLERETKKQLVLKGATQASMSLTDLYTSSGTSSSTVSGHEPSDHSLEFQEFQMATDQLVVLFLQDEQLKPLLDVAFM